MTHAGDVESIERWDASYAVKASDNLWGEPPVPFVVEAAGGLLADCETLLEVPCGDGRNTAVLARRRARLVAADSSPRALGIARERLRRLGVANVDFEAADVSALSLADDELDGVLCWDLLGHLREPLAALEELVRVCRPGGVVVGNLFALGDSTRGQNMVQEGAECYVYDGRFFFHYYDREETERLLAGVERATVEQLVSTRWSEPPHEGYREYPHEHESWAFALRITA